MNIVSQSYKLDMVPGDVPVIVPAKQYDVTARQIIFSLYYGETVFILEDSVNVRCDGTKPDGYGFSVDALHDGNQVTVVLTQQMTAKAGNVPCQLTVTQGTAVIGTAKFILAVEPAALSDDADMSASDISAVISAAQAAEEAASAAAQSAAQAAPAGLVTQIYSVSNDTELDNVCTQFFTSSSFENETVQHCVILATTTNTSIGGGHFACEIYKMNELYGCIKLSTYIGYGKSFCRVFFNGSLYPWDWINPQMNVDVEYRTTERHNGKTVYTKLVDFGTLPNSSSKSVVHNLGIFSVENIVSFEGVAVCPTDIVMLPFGLSGEFAAYAYINISAIVVRTVKDASNYSAKFIVKYTKTLGGSVTS